MIDELYEGGAFDDEDHNHWQPHRVDRETILKGITIVQVSFGHGMWPTRLMLAMMTLFFNVRFFAILFLVRRKK